MCIRDRPLEKNGFYLPDENSDASDLDDFIETTEESDEEATEDDFIGDIELDDFPIKDKGLLDLDIDIDDIANLDIDE